MQRATRTQVDEQQEYYSELTALDCSNSADMARQEFKKETDINDLMRRFGLSTPTRPPEYSDVDWNIDLQSALAAIADSKRAWYTLPDNLRQKYPNWRDLLNALEKGELTLHNEEPAIEPVQPTG